MVQEHYKDLKLCIGQYIKPATKGGLLAFIIALIIGVLFFNNYFSSIFFIISILLFPIVIIGLILLEFISLKMRE